VVTTTITTISGYWSRDLWTIFFHSSVFNSSSRMYFLNFDINFQFLKFYCFYNENPRNHIPDKYLALCKQTLLYSQNFPLSALVLRIRDMVKSLTVICLPLITYSALVLHFLMTIFTVCAYPQCTGVQFILTRWNYVQVFRSLTSYCINCINAPCQFTPSYFFALSLFSLTPFGWLNSITSINVL